MSYSKPGCATWAQTNGQEGGMSAYWSPCPQNSAKPTVAAHGLHLLPQSLPNQPPLSLDSCHSPFAHETALLPMFSLSASLCVSGAEGEKLGLLCVCFKAGCHVAQAGYIAEDDCELLLLPLSPKRYNHNQETLCDLRETVLTSSRHHPPQ